MIDYKYIYNKQKFDLISKLNLYNKNQIIELDKILIYVCVKTNDNNFLSIILNLSKICFNWFNRKIQVLSIKNYNFNSRNRNSLIFKFGLTLRDKSKMFFLINYLNNVVLPYSKTIDNNFMRYKKNNSLFFSFSNVNYLLGFPTEKYYTWNNEIFIELKFNNPPSHYLDYK